MGFDEGGTVDYTPGPGDRVRHPIHGVGYVVGPEHGGYRVKWESHWTTRGHLLDAADWDALTLVYRSPPAPSIADVLHYD